MAVVNSGKRLLDTNPTACSAGALVPASPSSIEPSRRQFLRRTTALGAAGLIPYHFTSAHARAPSPNDRLRFALIGVGGNGTRSVPVPQEFADLVALCDVDSAHLARGNELLCDGKADLYADYREVLARDDIDVVQISTPDHWHAKILVEAMRSGKDAYCEKPLTLTIDEGKVVRRVLQETGRVVQVGTQQRSMFELFVKAQAIIAAGRLGKLRRVRAGVNRGAWSPPIPVAEPPKTLDWDRWLGPATKADFRYAVNPQTESRPYTNSHTQFRWWYEYSGGKLTDWGAHHVDIAMLGIAAAGQSIDPVSVSGVSKHAVEFADGKPLQTDRYNTAQSFDLTVRFAEGDVELKIESDYENGILFEGELGRIFVNRGKLVGKPVEDLANNPLPEDAIAEAYKGFPMQYSGRKAHWANLLHAIERRMQPISDVQSHMKMLNVCHLAGICCRLGREVNWDQATEQIVGDELAASMMKRPYREGFEIAPA